jgi:hypothetical protein
MASRIFAAVPLIALAIPMMASSQEPPPTAPRGVVAPDQKLPSYIRKLTSFGERAEFSLDSARVIFLTKTFGDVMEYDLATGEIRNLTSHFPHYGFTRALYLANGQILLAGPTEYDLKNPASARANCWMFILDPDSGRLPQPLNMKVAEGPVPSRKRMHLAWSQRADAFPGEMAPGSSRMFEADIVFDNGVPKLANQKLILQSGDLPFRATIEPQNFRPPAETELTFSAYDYQQTEVFGIDLASKRLTNYSNAPMVYDEPEGIFPDGKSTTVESDHHNPAGKGFDRADIYRLTLDGSGTMQRLTCFANVPTYRASNPVVSDDGRYMAFQMGRSGVAAGTGWGIFLYDLKAAGPKPTC